MDNINSRQLVIIILGPPGSGKGTQAELLGENLGLFHFETSEVIENNFKKAKKGDFVKVNDKKYFLEEERKLRNSGKIMSPPLISFWVEKSIKELKRQGRGVVISGSPRSVYEAERLFPILQKLYGKENIKIIIIEQSSSASIFRNSKRRICQLMRHPILYSKETARLKICPLDGSNLVKRGKLDLSETIKKRIKEYKEKTLPIIKFLENKEFQIIKINGEKSVSNVFRDIRKVILKN